MRIFQAERLRYVVTRALGQGLGTSPTSKHVHMETSTSRQMSVCDSDDRPQHDEVEINRALYTFS